jgi:hypothetical protein
VPVKRSRKGAEPKLTVETGRILAALNAGNFRTVAARLAGLKPEVLVKWLERGSAASSRSRTLPRRWRVPRPAVNRRRWRSGRVRGRRLEIQERFLSKRFQHNWSDRSQLPLRDQVVEVF